MKGSKMVELLKYFQPRELNSFKEFLASPFFNKDEELISFFTHIKKFAPDYDSPKIEKNYLLTHGIPGVQLNEKRLGYLMNYIVEQAEHFIMYQSFFEDETDGYIRLLKKYNKWNADKFFENTLRRTRAIQDKQEFRTAEFFLKEYTIETEVNYFFDKQKVRSFDASLQKAADYLDLFYLSTKLKYLCELMNRQMLVAANYEMHLLKEIFIHLQENKYENYPAITVYYKILMTFLEPEHLPHFYELKTLLEKHASQFPATDAKDMYIYAQNYCITKANSGRTDFLSELLSLYRSSLEKEIILSEGEISPWSYKNIVSVAARVGETEWAEQFVLKFANKLNDRFRDNAYTYNYAYVKYAQGKYGEALKLLQTVEFTDVFYALDSRTLMVKIYYEMNEVSSLMSLLDAFRVYLRRNKTISSQMATVYMNFVKFTDKLLRAEHDKKKRQSLSEQIKETQQVADKNWLLQKLSIFFLLIVENPVFLFIPV